MVISKEWKVETMVEGFGPGEAMNISYAADITRKWQCECCLKTYGFIATPTHNTRNGC